MATKRNRVFKMSGKLLRPAYPGFILIKVAMGIQTNATAKQVVMGGIGPEVLNSKNLLRHSVQDSLFQPIEFVEKTPCSNLAKATEPTTHRIEVEFFVTIKNKNKSTQLSAQSLDSFGLSYPFGPAGTGKTETVKASGAQRTGLELMSSTPCRSVESALISRQCLDI